MFASALVVGAVVVYAAIGLLFVYFRGVNDVAYPREYPMAQVGTPAQPPAPRLQTKPREELKRMRAEEDALLYTSGWVDPARGVTRIPVSRAMELVIEQGLPVRTRSPGSVPPLAPQVSSSSRTMTK
jgi:hypothetical protein